MGVTGWAWSGVGVGAARSKGLGDRAAGDTPLGLPDRSDTGFAAPTVGGCAIDRAVFGESRIGLGQLTEWQWEGSGLVCPRSLRSGESEFGQRA